jgi:uncharacterized damage-inducible protein DinB
MLKSSYHNHYTGVKIMPAMSVYRNWQFDSMEKSLIIADQMLSSLSDLSVFDKRDGGDGWTISEVLGHLVDVEAIFHERARLTIESDNPDLPFSDPNELVIEHGFAGQNARDVFKQWQVNRAPFLAYLKSLSDDETTWERPAQHPTRGNFTLNDQLMLAAWHDTNHIHQIVKIING